MTIRLMIPLYIPSDVPWSSGFTANVGLVGEPYERYLRRAFPTGINDAGERVWEEVEEMPWRWSCSCGMVSAGAFSNQHSSDADYAEHRKACRKSVGFSIGFKDGQALIEGPKDYSLDVRVVADQGPDGASLWQGNTQVPVMARDLPRVVRELAAMLTEEQRKDFDAERAESHMRRMEKMGFRWTLDSPLIRLCCGGVHEHKRDCAKRGGLDAWVQGVSKEGIFYNFPPSESGPGIAAMPEKSESVAFLDEDLLARDE